MKKYVILRQRKYESCMSPEAETSRQRGYCGNIPKIVESVRFQSCFYLF